MSSASSRQLIAPRQFAEVYQSWSQQIREALETPDEWAVVGIKRGGAQLAHRLHRDLDSDARKLRYGELDISLYRDDYHLQLASPQVLGTEIDFDVDKLSILLVDDVLYTGRTVRAAMDQLLDFGRPKRIWLAAFIDRGHRELPIASDYTGLDVVTRFKDRVLVNLREFGHEEDRVILEIAGSPTPDRSPPEKSPAEREKSAEGEGRV